MLGPGHNATQSEHVIICEIKVNYLVHSLLVLDVGADCHCTAENEQV